jgi:hypothetical protein
MNLCVTTKSGSVVCVKLTCAAAKSGSVIGVEHPLAQPNVAQGVFVYSFFIIFSLAFERYKN